MYNLAVLNVSTQHVGVSSVAAAYLFLSAEFSYDQVYRLWETVWTARLTVSQNFEEFLAMAIMKQFK